MSFDRDAPPIHAAQPIPVLRILGLVALALVLRGCAAHRVAPASQQACTPSVDHQLVAGARGDALEGAFVLILVATEGPGAGGSSRGTMALFQNDTTLRRIGFANGSGSYQPHVSIPLIGTADIALGTIGGVQVGDLGSSDPLRPGVVVLERQVMTAAETTLTEFTLRLGSEANRRDVTRFDGGFMALYVRAIDPRGFRGTWASGIAGPEARGYFCAVRRGES